MKSLVRCATAAVSVVAFFMIAPAAFAVETGAGKYIGQPGDASMVGRVVTIAPNAKWVNVVRGETVKFVDQATGQSFVWQFDTPSWAVVDLSEAAPSALSGRHISAYVETDPNDNAGD